MDGKVPFKWMSPGTSTKNISRLVTSLFWGLLAPGKSTRFNSKINSIHLSVVIRVFDGSYMDYESWRLEFRRVDLGNHVLGTTAVSSKDQSRSLAVPEGRRKTGKTRKLSRQRVRRNRARDMKVCDLLGYLNSSYADLWTVLLIIKRDDKTNKIRTRDRIKKNQKDEQSIWSTL